MFSRFYRIARIAVFSLICHPLISSLLAADSTPVFKAGAYAIDINPTKMPVIVNGSFREKTTDTILDPLHARCLVLDDGNERIAIVVVDSCMVPRDLLDQAKALANKSAGIRADRMLISSTHTHSAPSAMGALGSSADSNYIEELPGMIAEGIKLANDRLQPARVGWAVVDAPDHTNCRRWILRSDKMRVDPFGDKTVRAHMHPGHQNPDFIGPSGPVDTGLTMLSVQTAEGKPLAMFANFSMHYYGSGALSADYYGAFSEEFAKQIGAGDGRSDFVAAMSQGTSGDLQWMDYGAPAMPRDLRKYSTELAAIARGAYDKIHYRPWVSLAMAETKLKLRRRVADEKRLEWARKVTATLTGRKPISQEEIYAREQVIIAEDPERELILQAARVGDLGITAIPNEVYSITGLKLKAQSPLQPTMNIELANGGEGYIPPAEQHRLGGYTTWEARSASLETNAEPKIVEALLTLLEKVAEKPRRAIAESHGAYAKAVLAAKPLAYWRMGEMEGELARDSSGNGRHAKLEHGYALQLNGAPGAGFCESGVENRAIQFAGGAFNSKFPDLKGDYSVEFWCWNGLPGGKLQAPYFRGGEFLALLTGGSSDGARLELVQSGRSLSELGGQTWVRVKTWTHIAVVHKGERVSVWLDGEKEIDGNIHPAELKLIQNEKIGFGAEFEGRLDEVAVYDRALSEKEIQSRVQLSGIEAWREEKRVAARKAAEARTMQLAGPTVDKGYAKAIADLKPAIRWSFDGGSGASGMADSVDGGVEMAEASVDAPNMAARFSGGRVKADASPLPLDYSVSLWFCNDQPNDSRAVTGYFFSRGPEGDKSCPGDHFGIGGTYRPEFTGKLIVFNGNRLDQAAAGRTTIQPRTWNHVVMARKGGRVTVWLNGGAKPEIDAELPVSIGAGEARVFFGGRNDNFSNLNGLLDEAVVFDRALTAKEARTLFVAAGVEAPTAARQDPATARPATSLESEPRSPAEGLKSIHVPEGFAVELVAAEPLVRDPVAIDWGADGRLWVAEMADYPNGMDDKGKPGGRIRVLKDTDGDGRFDESTLFLDGLNFPNGVMAWKKGALITAAPKIIYAEDADGDGKADSRRTMYEGFFEGNQQLRVNGLRWGLDNWIYCASGSHRPGYGGKVMIKSHNGTSWEVGSNDFKIRPETGELIAVSGPSQFGRDRDDWGNWFGEQNSYPMWHYVIEDHYLRRNPDVAFDSPKKTLTPGNPQVYPAKSPQKRFHSFTQSGRYTSACSAMVYRDELLFGRGEVTHGFTCEPFHNLVQHHILKEDGVSFALGRDPSEGELDFFASDDRWCRPVQARTGPDGALWVVDMYRYMIEHPQWLPPAGQEELRPHYREGEDKGRIYRLVRKGAPRHGTADLSRSSAGGLVQALAHPSGAARDLAQRTLIDRGGDEAVSELRALLGASVNPLGRLHALCALDGLGALAAKDVIAGLKDKHPSVRRRAIKLLESLSVAEQRKALDGISFPNEEPDAKARLQWALALGELDGEEPADELAWLAASETGDSFMRMAILSSAPRHYESVVNGVLAKGGPAHPLFFDLLRMGMKRPAGLGPIFLSLMSVDESGGYSSAQMVVLSRWLDTLSRESQSLETFSARHQGIGNVAGGVDSMLNAARELAGKNGASEAERVVAFGLLGKQADKRDADMAALAGMLNPRQSSAIQSAATKALLQGWKATAAAAIFGRWASLAPAVRQMVVNESLSQNDTTLALLAAIEKGAVSPSDLDAAQRQRLSKHKNQAIRERAGKALKTAGNADRQKLVAAFRPALRLKPNVANGKAVFVRLCAVCHQPPTGEPVGPDLRSITDKSPEGLLSAILDPNQSSDPRYNVYNIDLKDDTALAGLIVSESGASLTLRSADGAEHVILRSQIAAFSGGSLSLMPEGLEQGLERQDLGDVIAYVREGLGR